jgi:hypothetical protein
MNFPSFPFRCVNKGSTFSSKKKYLNPRALDYSFCTSLSIKCSHSSFQIIMVDCSLVLQMSKTHFYLTSPQNISYICANLVGYLNRD